MKKIEKEKGNNLRKTVRK